MGFAVTIRQVPDPLEVGMGETILQAALAAGIDYPHGCRSGNCGACKSRLHAGEVELSPFSEYALSAEERESGLILACRAVPWSAAEVAWLEPDEVVSHPLRRLTCRLADATRMTRDIVRLRLAIEAGGPFDYTAGQYARLTVGDLPGRDYSMASTPESVRATGEIEFHIRALPGGRVSQRLFDLAGECDRCDTVGGGFRVEGPYGIAYYRGQHTGPIIALAGGSGLAPIKAIVESALEGGAKQPIRLYFGVRDEPDAYHEALFRDLTRKHDNFSYRIVLSEPDGPTERPTGFLADVVAADFSDLDGAKAYLAGPPPMVESCVAAVRALGVRAEDCHADAFYTEAEKAALEATG